MKRILSLILAFVLIFALSACGEEEKPTVSGSGTNVNTDNISGVEDTTDKTDKQTYNFKNTGNHPNNLYHSQYTPAFDNNYIYFSDNGIYRVDYNGLNKQKLSENEAYRLNLLGGYLYYAFEDGINRLNVETLAEETIVQTSDKEEILALLVVDEFVLYTVESGKTCLSYALNLNDNTSLLLNTTDGDDYDTDVFFSTTKDAVICFEYDSNRKSSGGKSTIMLSYSFDMLKKATSSEDINGKSDALGTTRSTPSAWQLASDGIYQLGYSSGLSSTVSHNIYHYSYDDIDYEKQEWDCVKKSGFDGENAQSYIGKGTSYMLKNNLLIFDTRCNADETDEEAEIHFFEDCDLGKGKILDEIPIKRLYVNNQRGISGVHNDNMFIILKPYLDVTNYTLIIVSTNGEIQKIDFN